MSEASTSAQRMFHVDGVFDSLLQIIMPLRLPSCFTDSYLAISRCILGVAGSESLIKQAKVPCSAYYLGSGCPITIIVLQIASPL